VKKATDRLSRAGSNEPDLSDPKVTPAGCTDPTSAPSDARHHYSTADPPALSAEPLFSEANEPLPRPFGN
jgi:hypothetical protein